jgi:hypothetical protein
MNEYLSITSLLAEFGANTKALVLKDDRCQCIISLPHPKYPQDSPIHFFICKNASGTFRVEIVNIQSIQKNKSLCPVKSKIYKTVLNKRLGINSHENVNLLTMPVHKVYSLIT